MIEINIKYTFVGDSTVGKSSLLHSLKYNEFTLKKPTIGIDHYFLQLAIDNKLLKIHLWDTAGQERFRSICSHFYKDACLIFIVFDLTNRASFENLKYWIDETNKHKNEHTEIIILGNKSDLINMRTISNEEIYDYLKNYNLTYYETNAKSKYTNFIINDVSTKLLKNPLINLNNSGNINIENNVGYLLSNSKKKPCCY